MNPAEDSVEASFFDVAGAESGVGNESDFGGASGASGMQWPGFTAEHDFLVTPTASSLLSQMSLPLDDDPEGPLLDALARLHAEQARSSRLESALDVSRALGGLSHSGRPDEAAAVVQAAFRGRRVRVATAAARQARRERSAGLLQCRVRLLLARRARLDALACRLQHALRTYLNRTLPASTKSALRRDVLRSRQSVAEQEAALAKKDEALERLIERQLSRFGVGMPMAQSPVPIGPPMASMSPMATMAMPMASAVPVPVAMERDAAARLRDAEVLCTRLETEKDDLASQLNEALEHNHQLAEEATALRFAKDAAEECASQLLAQRLREEDEKDDDGPLGAPVVSGPTQ